MTRTDRMVPMEVPYVGADVKELMAAVGASLSWSMRITGTEDNPPPESKDDRRMAVMLPTPAFVAVTDAQIPFTLTNFVAEPIIQ